MLKSAYDIRQTPGRSWENTQYKNVKSHYEYATLNKCVFRILLKVSMDWEHLMEMGSMLQREGLHAQSNDCQKLIFPPQGDIVPVLFWERCSWDTKYPLIQKAVAIIQPGCHCRMYHFVSRGFVKVLSNLIYGIQVMVNILSNFVYMIIKTTGWIKQSTKVPAWFNTWCNGWITNIDV